jgi:nucleotide-binding universal stress UspA family protein
MGADADDAACPAGDHRAMIVVGIDGSEGAERALAFAAQEARLRERGLRVVAAWDVPTGFYSGGGMTPTVSGEEFRISTTAAVERQAADGLARFADLTTELLILKGNPAKVLLEQSKNADMLVLGSRGLGGFRGLMLGSVGQQCVQHAHCPVVIVPVHAEGQWAPPL